LPRTLIPEDLPIIEEKMKQILKQELSFERSEIAIDEALKTLEKSDQIYKKELIEDLKKAGEETVSFYKTGEFIDLCQGPHVESTLNLRSAAFKLDKIAGAYWRGSEKNKMLQRIYALAFASKDELKAYEQQMVEAEKRDHRKLGQELDLFSFHEEAPGFPFWHPKGMVLWNLLLDWWRTEHKAAGYVEVSTPMILSKELWLTSGHWDHYKDNMYFTEIDERDFAVKPMNCPGGILLYKEKLHSYKEFPIKIGEIGHVHRHELAGVLHGLTRVRAFRQDDAHIYCMPEQIEGEIAEIMKLIEKMYGRLGLKYKVELSTRPEKNTVGSDADWKKAEQSLKDALTKQKVDYKINPGDGAFYGPKIDFHITDAIGRSWQLGTIQLDFSMPELFELEYIAEDGKKKRPVMLHRVVFGSLERFIGILIEHFAGALPVWLAPVQVMILPITDNQTKFAQELQEQLEKAGVRVEIDFRNESIGKKIRESEMQKVPYMLVIGQREAADNKVAVREFGKGDLGQETIEEFIKRING